VLVEIQKLQDQVSQQERKDLLAWISPTDHWDRQSELLHAVAPDTCQGFLQPRRVVAWLHGTDKNLFCYGMPGAGKTIVAALTLAELRNRYTCNMADDGPHPASPAIACVFFDFMLKEEQRVNRIILDILKQVIWKDFNPVKKLHDMCTGRERPSLEEAKKALLSALRLRPRTFLVLDALDECSDSEEILAILMEYCSLGNLHILATSRDTPAFQKLCNSQGLRIRADDEDIETYVKRRIPRKTRFLARHTNIDGLDMDTVSKTIAITARGMCVHPHWTTDPGET
jgi:hypothetical protein